MRKMIRFLLVITFIYALIWTLFEMAINSRFHINYLLFFLISFCYLLFFTVGIQILLAYGQRQRTYEFVNGIIVTKRQQIVPLQSWEDLSTLTYKLVGINSPGFQVSTTNGETCVLYCDTVIPRIEQEIIRREFPEALTRYEAGETLNFNAIHVNKEALTSNSYNNRGSHNRPTKSISWSELEPSLKEENLEISFTKKADSKLFRLSLYDIPNACVLRELLIAITSPAYHLLRQQPLVIPPQDIS